MNAVRLKKVPLRAIDTIAYLCQLLCAVWLVQCAGQVFPGGGPVDTVPPIVVKTVPDTNAVHVQTNSIDLEFSEYVERRSVEESIFISPYVGQLEFDWSGTSVTVNFSGPLRKNTTYVVSVGTDVVDVRARNRMASSYTLAFSTGDSIDRGFISGRVFDEKPEGVMVFAYALQGLNPDTLDPGRLKPDYIVQTGLGGTFALSNLAFGRYRVFAVRDEYRNLLYEREVDGYGVTVNDITVSATQERVSEIWFRLSREDTTKPFLTSVTPTDRYQVLARFSEPVDTISFSRTLFSVSDTLTKEIVPVLLAYVNRVNCMQAGVVLATPLDSGRTYRMRVADVFDRAGNPIDTVHASYVFAGTNQPDTLKPVVSVRDLVDSTRGVPLDRPLEIHFSEPVRQSPLAHAILLADTGRRAVGAKLSWINAVDIGLIPENQLRGDTWYQIRVVMDSVRDLQGNGYKDSVYVLRFQTLDLRTTGTIEGVVVDAQQDRGKGAIYVTATGLDARATKDYTTRLENPGKITMANLPEGRYVISGFRDADRSGSYTYGRPFPFVPSERFAAYPDTIKVRARWSVEGVTVTFR